MNWFVLKQLHFHLVLPNVRGYVQGYIFVRPDFAHCSEGFAFYALRPLFKIQSVGATKYWT